MRYYRAFWFTLAVLTGLGNAEAGWLAIRAVYYAALAVLVVAFVKACAEIVNQRGTKQAEGSASDLFVHSPNGGPPGIRTQDRRIKRSSPASPPARAGRRRGLAPDTQTALEVRAVVLRAPELVNQR